MKFVLENASKIKLIIWDLDDTFWKGTLSDYDTEIEPIQINNDLVKILTARGIINSICSKNDKKRAEQKLDEFGVGEYFVFSSINWEGKGNRIKNMLASMALRPQNVLFIDDNNYNLAEVEHAVPELMVATPEIIEEIYRIADTLGKEDNNHSRLKQYKVLEKKKEDAEEFESNTDFLMQSNIQIKYCDIDEESIPRIEELIQRTNQLNFTKKRIGESEIRQLLADSKYKLGYVKVSDNYGKYGIVGFYALNKKMHVLEHFLFSCRIMGMGIEQHVFATLNYPQLDVVEPVSGNVTVFEGIPNYITKVDELDEDDGKGASMDKARLRILLKGPCDLEVMASFLEGGDVCVEKEFNFVDHKGNQADYYNHLINILNCNENTSDKWCDKYSFLAPEGFKTKLFSGEYDVVCLSPLMDATLAVYEDDDGDKLAYGLYSKPITNKENHRSYIEGQIITAAHCSFYKKELEDFSKSFHLIDYSPEAIAKNLLTVIDEVKLKNENTRFVIILLGELEYNYAGGKYAEFFKDKHLLHREINGRIRDVLGDNDSVYLLDVNKYINCQNDYFDNINHYSKYVYYEMAREFVQHIEKTTNVRMSTASKIKARIQNIKRSVYKKLLMKKSQKEIKAEDVNNGD